MYRMVAVVMIYLIALACAGNAFADDWEWFLAPEGMKKEFEIRNPSGNNPVVGKTTQIVSEIEDDQFGDKTVKIVFKSSFGQMSTNGYRLYKLDMGTNRILQIEMYNQQTELRQTWDDPYPYVIMKFDMTGRPGVLPVRVVWRKYQDGDWQIEFVSPQELSMALMMDKMVEQYKKR